MIMSYNWNPVEFLTHGAKLIDGFDFSHTSMGVKPLK
jgi:hypothetical protein